MTSENFWALVLLPPVIKAVNGLVNTSSNKPSKVTCRPTSVLSKLSNVATHVLRQGVTLQIDCSEQEL